MGQRSSHQIKHTDANRDENGLRNVNESGKVMSDTYTKTYLSEAQFVNDYLLRSQNSSTGIKSVIAVIEMGTYMSGYAYSLSTGNETIYYNKPIANEFRQTATLKEPTYVLTDKDLKFKAFGYEALRLCTQEPQSYHLFVQLRKSLQNKLGVNQDAQLVSLDGKEASAINIIAMALKALKQRCELDIKRVFLQGEKRFLQRLDISWVLTVLPRTSTTGKRLYEWAANEAGIWNPKFVEETTSATYSFRNHYGSSRLVEPDLLFNSDVMIVDCGGEFVKVMLCRPMPNDNGLSIMQQGIDYTDIGLHRAFKSQFGDAFVHEYSANYTGDWMQSVIINDIVLQSYNPQQPYDMELRLQPSFAYAILDRFGISLDNFIGDQAYGIGYKDGKITLDSNVVYRMFKPCVYRTTKLMKDVLKNLKLTYVPFIYMIGGASEYQILRMAVEKDFNECRIVYPNDHFRCVLKGSILWAKDNSYD